MVATQTSVNLALASSSEYIKQQLGLPTSARTTSKRRNSDGGLVVGTPRSGTPSYKSQEEMYDEIIELKKVSMRKKSEC